MTWQKRMGINDAGEPVERWLRAVIVAGALMMAAGALLPWIEAVTISGLQYQDGIDLFAGRVVIILAVATLATAIAGIPLELAFVLAGSAGVMEAAWLMGNLPAFTQPPGPDFDLTPASGFGVAVLGTALATLSGLVHAVGRRTPGAPPRPAAAPPPPPTKPRLTRTGERERT